VNKQLLHHDAETTKALVNEHLSDITPTTLAKFVQSCWREGDEIEKREIEIEELIKAMQLDPDAEEPDDEPILQIINQEIEPPFEAPIAYIRNRNANWAVLDEEIIELSSSGEESDEIKVQCDAINRRKLSVLSNE